MTGGAGGWGMAVEEQLKRSLQTEMLRIWIRWMSISGCDTGLQDGTTGESE